MTEINLQLKRLLDHWGIKDQDQQRIANRPLKEEEITDFLGSINAQNDLATKNLPNKKNNPSWTKPDNENNDSIYTRMEIGLLDQLTEKNYKNQRYTFNDAFAGLNDALEGGAPNLSTSIVDNFIALDKKIPKNSFDRHSVDKLKYFIQGTKGTDIPVPAQPQKAPVGEVVVGSGNSTEANQKLQAFTKLLGDQNGSVAAKLKDQKINPDDLMRVLQEALKLKGKERDSFVDDGPFSPNIPEDKKPSITWGQLFDPATKLTMDIKSYSLGAALTEAVRSELKGTKSLKDVEGKNDKLVTNALIYESPNHLAIIPELNPNKAPPQSPTPAPWAPPAPELKNRGDEIRINFDEIIEGAGIKTAILSNEEAPLHLAVDKPKGGISISFNSTKS